MTRYVFPIIVSVMLAAIVYMVITYRLYWVISALTRAGGVS